MPAPGEGADVDAVGAGGQPGAGQEVAGGQAEQRAPRPPPPAPARRRRGRRRETARPSAHDRQRGRLAGAGGPLHRPSLPARRPVIRSRPGGRSAAPDLSRRGARPCVMPSSVPPSVRPVGKRGGGLSGVHAVDLSAHVLDRARRAVGHRPRRRRGRLLGLRQPGRRADLQHRPQRPAGGRLARVGARHDDRPAVRLLPAGGRVRRGDGDQRAGRRRRRRRCGVDEPGPDGLVGGRRVDRASRWARRSWPATAASHPTRASARR